MSQFEHIPEQPEDVVPRPAMWALGGAVLAIVVCAVVVWTLGAFQLVGGGETAQRAEGQTIESTPPARPFSDTPTLERRRSEAREQLDTWTWADRAAHRVRVPVDVAIDRYLEQRGGR